MADFRSIQTRMWREDAWFQDLKTDERLFWIYLFSNPSASICGMYRLPIRTMAFESGLSEARITELLQAFAAAGKAYYENGTIWIVRMRENQLGKKISPNQATGLANDLAKLPPSPLKNRYLAHYGYPIDTLSSAPDTLCIPPATLRYDTVRNDTLGNDTKPSEPPPPLPLTPSSASGRAEQSALEKLNGRLGPQLRRPLCDVVKAITGTAALSDLPSPPGQVANIAAHTAACDLWDVGYKSEADLLDLEAKWYTDSFIGKKGDKPTCAQLTAFASDQKAGDRSNGKKETPTYASNRNNGNGYGLKRKPDDRAAREPTEDERREWAEWRAAHPESA